MSATIVKASELNISDKQSIVNEVGKLMFTMFRVEVLLQRLQSKAAEVNIKIQKSRYIISLNF